MGHVVNPDREYRLLQQRLDKSLTGAPDSPTLMRILRLLFSPEEAELARRVPGRPVSLQALARKLEIPAGELEPQLTDLAQRGLMLDFEYQGRRYFMLPPIVIGFFEFVFMRAREDMPMAELAELFHEYMYTDDRFVHTIFQQQTQIGRSLVREEALPQDDHTEVLDWERASKLVGEASAVAVSLCACRHKAQHLGQACGRPMEVCLTLNHSAESLARSGIARRITSGEGMRILEESKAAGLAQTGDNVQRNVSYICNCCGCCCGMMNAVRHFEIKNAIVTSNWIMSVDEARCRGCGECAKACPIQAIDIARRTSGGKEDGSVKRMAVCDASLCLGCGVCYGACKRDAIRMAPREKRVMTPEGTFDRVVAMAIERGKLAELFFEEPETWGYRALGRMISILEHTPPARALLAVQPLRSAFLSALVSGVKRFS